MTTERDTRNNKPRTIETFADYARDGSSAWGEYVKVAEGRYAEFLTARYDREIKPVKRLFALYPTLDTYKTALYDYSQRLNDFDLAFRGWSEGAEQIEEATRAIYERISNHLRVLEPIFDTTGATFDIGLYTAGIPEHWVRNELTETVGCRIILSPEIIVTTDLTASALRGAAVIALTQALERSGKRVELWLGFDTTTDVGHYETRVLLKREQDYTTFTNLAFPCCHAGFLRSLEFCNIEHHWGTGVVQEGCYGRNSGVTLEGDIVIDGNWKSIIRTLTTPDLAAEWIEGVLKAQGVELL